ncbi:MAG: hypothetical protein LBJ21_08040, partial [Acidobacteriota bacterium]|nr:hypothetical protein [Acidobacteriota bacterium]
HYSATVGIGVYQGITSWLSLGTSYSIQLNDDLKENQAHRVEIGRLQFNLSQNTVVYTSGGVVISKNYNRIEEGYEIRPTARAGISWSTEAGRLYAEYSRTMMSVSGSRRLLPSDTVSAGLGKPIGGRINLRLIGYYQRSSDSTDSGQLSVYQGQASLECLLVQGLSMSANYTYRYQDNSINVLGGIPYAERQTISAGLQYNWPSRRTGY